MNILQVLPKLNIGGVEKGTIDLSRHLMSNNCKAVVVSDGGIFVKDLVEMGAIHYKLPIGKKNPFTIIYCYFKLKQIIQKEAIDIVHARSRIPALTSYFAARSLRVLFITTAHGQYKKHLISKVMGWGKIVIVANTTMAKYMKDNFSVPLEKMKIIPRGVDIEKFKFLSPLKRQKKVFTVGMICRFTFLKGHLDFLKAMSYISRKMFNIKIILMGDIKRAKEEYMKKIKLNIKHFMLDDFVEIKDSNEDVAHVMQSLNVFVAANREQEAFGRTIIEAQSCGTIVVATKVGGLMEIIEHNVTGLLCEAMNPLDMSEKIFNYTKDSNLMENIAINARKQVEEKYSLRNMMQMTLDTYNKAIGMKKILILKISSLGDVILSIPSIRAIREKFPEAIIKVLVDVKFREVLDNCPYINDVITCDFSFRDKAIGFLKFANRLRKEDFDISIDLQNNRKTHILAFLSRIPERYGYNNKKWSCLLTNKIDLPKIVKNPIEHQEYLLRLLGISKLEETFELWRNDKSDIWAKQFLNQNWINKKQKLIAINMSASIAWKTKNWDISYIIELSELLASKISARVMLLGTDKDIIDAEYIVRKSTCKPINAVGKTNISQLISLIDLSDALLTVDSASLHIATATKTPFVALFGPTDYRRHLVPNNKYKMLYKNLRCSPCYKSTCIRKYKCMKSIKPIEVFNALMEIIN